MLICCTSSFLLPLSFSSLSLPLLLIFQFIFIRLECFAMFWTTVNNPLNFLVHSNFPKNVKMLFYIKKFNINVITFHDSRFIFEKSTSLSKTYSFIFQPVIAISGLCFTLLLCVLFYSFLFVLLVLCLVLLFIRSIVYNCICVETCNLSAPFLFLY